MKLTFIKNQYHLWLQYTANDLNLQKELKDMEHDKKKIEDAFYRNLNFGTGGLRGKIGAGTNRMNIYTVAKATQGIANYLLKQKSPSQKQIAISYDSRINSKLFAEIAAAVFYANGINVHIYNELMPTPCLSYAVRTLSCAMGVMITASHNSAEYNGYKVYDADGCQITTEVANDILDEINMIDIFQNIKWGNFEKGIKEKKILYISKDLIDRYLEDVKKSSIFCANEINKTISIVYTPLNGTGLKPVIKALNESGYTNITLVKEQEIPDGRFPTCSYPNPEDPQAMALAIDYAKKQNAEVVLATDPDCDRVGIAIRNRKNKYETLSGNEIGILLFDYICKKRINNHTMPKNPVMFKTIVTTPMVNKIASDYGVKVVDVLTGFKFIGEQIGILEKQNKKDNFIFGFEESLGYLSGTYVRDKDAVNASLLICEMVADYYTHGIRLLDKLDELYSTYGYYLNTLHSYTFEGSQGYKTMQCIMEKFRNTKEILCNKRIVEVIDYENGINGLPKSNVLKFLFDDDSSIIIRPSGTEPKLKMYISIIASSKEVANEEVYKIENLFHEELNRIERMVYDGKYAGV